VAFASILTLALACVAQDGSPAKRIEPSVATASQPVPANTAESPGADRSKQISDESSQLLAMAVALKAEVDKTNKDTLSLKVIRKADEIERLAHTVKEKMKQKSGSN
jgi:hypothetical protein